MIPDITVLWVIAFLLLTTFLLNALIFKPVLKVIEARVKAVTDARDLAQTAADRATTAGNEYTQKLNVARSEVYRQMDEKRRVAMEQRAALLGQTRSMVERELADATARVQQQAADARATLDREGETLAGAIVTRILGRAS